MVALLGVASAVGIAASVRRRLRVRRLMAEDPTTSDPTCTIDRHGARQFFAETRVFRAAIEDQLLNTGSPILVVDDIHDAVLRSANFDRAVHDWLQVYRESIDDQDREALADRGITAQRIAAFERVGGRMKKNELRALLVDIGDLEQRMTQAPRLSAYR